MQSSILKATKREQALKRISQRENLSDVYRLEEELTEDLISKALDRVDVDYHWHDYERLKETMSQFVGFDASHSELQTTRHYEAMLDFIDWLLILSRKSVVVIKERQDDAEEIFA